MKKLKLVLGSYRDNWLSLVLISLVLACGLLFTLFFGSQVRCKFYTAELLSAGGEDMNTSLYVMAQRSDLIEKKDVDAYRQMPGVRDVLYQPSFNFAAYKGTTLNLTYYPEGMQEQFPLPLSEGRWPQKGSGMPEAVVAGAGIAKVGDVITLACRDMEARKYVNYQVRVCGLIRFPAYLPGFNGSGTNVQADDLFSTGYAFVYLPRDQLLPIMDDAKHGTGSNFFIDFKDDATPAQMDAVKNKISEIGAYTSYEEIVKNTQKRVSYEVNRKLMGPAFFLLSVSMAFICVSGLLLKKNMATYSVYALAGCSKKRSMLLAALGVLPPVVVAGAVAFGFMGAYQYIYEYLPPSMNLFIMDGWTALTVGLYLLAVYALALLVPVVSIARHAPINLYREERE